MEHTHHHDHGDAKKGNELVMAILAYIGILVVIPYLVSKDDPFVKFHIKQGLVLLCIEIVVWIAGVIAWMLWPLLDIVNLATLILSIIGIITATQHKEKALPIVGQYSRYFSSI